jgi:hypothetical protein
MQIESNSNGTYFGVHLERSFATKGTRTSKEFSSIAADNHKVRHSRSATAIGPEHVRMLTTTARSTWNPVELLGK